VGERRVAETLRTQASDHNPAAGRQQFDAPPADQERDQQDREREDDFSDSWQSYRERADRVGRAYGWRVPEPPPWTEPWLPLGRDED
jgi:hypothetical protein